MTNTRTIKCIKELRGEYITVDIEYSYFIRNNNVFYNRVKFPHSGSWISYKRFKQALRDGEIVFTDTLDLETN